MVFKSSLTERLRERASLATLLALVLVALVGSTLTGSGSLQAETPVESTQAQSAGKSKQPASESDSTKRASADAATPGHDLLAARDTIESFSEQYCSECHSGSRPDANLDIDGLVAADADISQAETWIKISSALKNGYMPPGEATQPLEEARRAAVAAIDLQLSTLACAGEKDPGRVTIRRLSRLEYTNTIRDLVGVPFEAAKDFPEDDIGYGFDNIGDVLSMPPLLMEKYLGAAEKILDAAIETRTTIEPRLTYFPPEQMKREPEMEADYGWLTQEGEVFVTFDAKHAGKYTLRMWAHGNQAGPDAARMGIKLGDKTLGEFDVAGKRGFAKPFEVTVSLLPGKHRVGASFLNDYWNPEAEKKWQRDRNLAIQSVEIVGPYEAAPPQLPATHHQLVFATPNETTTAKQAATQILEKFAQRAFRRPIKQEEVARLVELFEGAAEVGDSFESSIKVAMSAVLISPHFLYRIERDYEPTEPLGAYRISDYELASRLSYFLWSSMPDEELLSLAAAGTLHETGVLRSQVKRMLRSAKSRALVDSFAAQWLQLRRLDDVQPDPEQFDFDEDLRRAMYGEVASLFESVMREDRSVMELIDTDYTFLNERLARHYDIPGVQGEQMRRVPLPDQRRGGVLTSAAVLTVTSNPTRTSPVKRGRWILEQLLGVSNRSPMDVPPLEEKPTKETEGLTLRERLAQHTADPSCASCHMRLDPMGFALEHYDPVGRWRETDGDLPIDDVAKMPDGTEFVGAGGLKKIMGGQEKEFTRCLGRSMLTYALGRGLELYDTCTVQEITERVAAEDYRFSAMVEAIVESYPFQYRRILHEEEVADE